MYFLNLVANIAQAAEFLKYVTPFGYADGADIIEKGCLDGTLVAIGLAFGAIGIGAAYGKYCRKDIR
jgi:ABC-2 type transport system permease protein